MNDLYTAQEIESELGKAYFYRQRIYRMSQGGLPSFSIKEVLYFNLPDVVAIALRNLEERIKSRFPQVNTATLRASYDFQDKKLIRVEGLPGGRIVTADTEVETEEDLLEKVELIGMEVISMPAKHDPHHDPHHPPAPKPLYESRPGEHEHEPEPKRHHREVMEILRRIEEMLRRIEEKLDR